METFLNLNFKEDAWKWNIEQQCGANLETTVGTDTAVEPKPFHERARDAREHLATGVTLQDTIIRHPHRNKDKDTEKNKHT